MIKGLYIIPVDGEAYNIVVKHVHENILAGVHYILDTINWDKEYKQYIGSKSCDCFPVWFTGIKNRIQILNCIVTKVESNEEYELTDLEKFVLMHSLADYCEGCDSVYTLELANELCTSEGCEKSDYKTINIKPIKNAHKRMTVLTSILKNISEDELSSCVLDFKETVDNFMATIEDLTRYEDLFEDCDYELLGEYTPEQMKKVAAEHPELGIDVSNLV